MHTPKSPQPHCSTDVVGNTMQHSQGRSSSPEVLGTIEASLPDCPHSATAALLLWAAQCSTPKGDQAALKYMEEIKQTHSTWGRPGEHTWLTLAARPFMNSLSTTSLGSTARWPASWATDMPPGGHSKISSCPHMHVRAWWCAGGEIGREREKERERDTG